MRFFLLLICSCVMALSVIAQDDLTLEQALADGDSALETGDYATAEIAYQQAIELDPTSISAYLKLADVQLAQFNTSGAIASYTQGISANAEAFELYQARGKALMRMTAYQQAYTDLDQAIKLNRENASAYADMANLFVLVGNAANIDKNTEDAESYYALGLGQIETALAFDSENPQYYDIRARLHAGQSDLQAAMSDFNRAIELGEGNIAYLIARGEFLLQVGESEVALADFNKAIELAPDDSRGYNRIGSYYAYNKDLENAKSYYQQAIDADPDNPDAYFYLANIFGEEGKLPAAIELLNEAILINPYNDTLYLVRGDALRLSGDNEKAITDYTASLEIRPNDPRALITRAQSYLALEDNVNALADLRAFVDLIGEENAAQDVLDLIAELESKVGG